MGGMGAGPMSPQLMAMLQALQGGGPQGAAAAPSTGAPQLAGPMQSSGTMTPMSAYIGAGGNPGAMQGAPAMQPQMPQPMNQQQTMGQALSPYASLMQQLGQMGKGQTGVPPGGTAPVTPVAQSPLSAPGVAAAPASGAAQNSWLQMLLSHMGGMGGSGAAMGGGMGPGAAG